MTAEEKAAKEKAEQEEKDRKAKEAAEAEAEIKDLADLKLSPEVQDAVGKFIAQARKQARAKAKEEADAEKAALEAKAAEDKAKAEGKFEELAAAAQKRADEAEKALKDRDHRDLKRKILTDHKLDADAMIDRIKGDTEAELIEDAKSLAKLFGERKAPETELGDRNERKPENKVPKVSFSSGPTVPWPDVAAASSSGGEGK